MTTGATYQNAFFYGNISLFLYGKEALFAIFLQPLCINGRNPFCMVISPANSVDGVDIYLVAELIKYPKIKCHKHAIMQCANIDRVLLRTIQSTLYIINTRQKLAIKPRTNSPEPRTKCYLRHHSKVEDQFPTTYLQSGT